MPLQIRRGTDSQRLAMTQPLAVGELLYVTDTGALYIGDGETLGGNPTVNLTPEDVKNYTASMFTGGTHTSINYTFEDFVINSSVDLSAYEGDILPSEDSIYDLGSPSFKFKDLYLSGDTLYLGDAFITSTGTAINLPAGSTIDGVEIGTGSGTGDGVIEGSTYKINIAGDDSTLMIDTDNEIITAQGGFVGDITGTVNGDVYGELFGNVTGDVNGNVTGNLEGYVTGDVLGNVTGNLEGTVTGDVYGDVTGDVLGNVTGNVTGDVTGNLRSDNGTIVVWNGTDGTDATFTGQLNGSLVGYVLGNVTGELFGNSTGYHQGDMKGSVFADDSSIMVDAVDGKFYGILDTGNTVLDSNNITSTSLFDIGTPTSPINLRLNLSDNLLVRQLIGQSRGYLDTLMSRGSLANPVAIQAGDELGGLVVRGYTSSSTTGVAGGISFFADSTASISGGDFIKSRVVIGVSSDTTQDIEDALIVDSAGVVTSNAFSAYRYFQLPTYDDDAARLAAIPSPAAGMMVFMVEGATPAATNQMQVYSGSAWVNVT